jgi:DNA repair protein RadA/Sms
LVEEVAVARPAAAALSGAAVPLAEVPVALQPATPTGVAEFDRVLGGGLVVGSVTLVAGEPGVGKSTLLLQAAVARAGAGDTVLYVSAEESPAQVRARAARLGELAPTLWITAETALPGILAAIEQVRPGLVVVDSVQTVADPELGSAPGSVVQVRECAHRLTRVAKERGFACLLVGHVTKEGSIAGPRLLEHLVDTVVSVDGDRHHGLRLLRAVKHRFGATGEVGVLEMAGDGLRGVPDASALLLADRRDGVPGGAVVPVLEGRRPLLVEVQALVCPPSGPPTVRALGTDTGRLQVLVGVLRQWAGVPLGGCDVTASVVGGIRVTEPGADVGLCLALVSSVSGRPVPAGVVAVGEVGLGGELRQAAHTPRRLAEAARLGFRRAVVPVSTPPIEGVELLRAGSIDEALHLAGLVEGRGMRLVPNGRRTAG